MIEIDLALLRRASSLLLDHLEERGVTSIHVDQDFYWQISEADRYDVERKPDVFEIGQLSEDWEHIKRIVDGSADPLAFALCWLAPILSAVGEKVVR